MKKISIIVPVYYNQDNLLPLYVDLKEKVLTKLNMEYELIFVDDGSKDKSYEVMQNIAKLDKNIKNLRLSRNFGEHSALLAGLSQCTGDCAVRKAADLQEPSEMILEMIKKYEEGNEVVLAVRADREEPISQIILKKSASKKYNSIFREYFNVYVILGYGLMVISTILVVLGLKGVQYKNQPIIESLGYIFVMILSNLFLGEKITKKKIIGNFLILFGIVVYYI